MKEYVVNKISPETSTLDWGKAHVLHDFQYPWELELIPKMVFKGLWDDTYLHFRLEVTDINFHTYIRDNNKMEVNDSDRVELFFRTNKSMTPYYGLEMDSKARIMAYRANYYRRLDFDWTWPHEELKIQSNITNMGYIIEGSISLKSLKQLNLLQNDTVQCGIFRGDCKLNKDSKSELKWISWIDPQTSEPDFHVPSSFGILKFQGL